jgi:hypothetical protein
MWQLYGFNRFLVSLGLSRNFLSTIKGEIILVDRVETGRSLNSFISILEIFLKSLAPGLKEKIRIIAFQGMPMPSYLNVMFNIPAEFIPITTDTLAATGNKARALGHYNYPEEWEDYANKIEELSNLHISPTVQERIKQIDEYAEQNPRR